MAGSKRQFYSPLAQDAAAPQGQMALEQKIAELGAGMEQMQNGMQQLAQGGKELKNGLQELASNLRVTTLDSGIKIGVFGYLRGEMLLSDVRPIIGSAPFFLSPNTGLNQDTVDIHGKSTALGAAVEGPEICGYQSGGLILIYFFGQQVFANTTGVFFAQGYGELKSDVDRLAFGVQADVFNPVNPTVLNWGNYLALATPASCAVNCATNATANLIQTINGPSRPRLAILCRLSFSRSKTPPLSRTTVGRTWKDAWRTVSDPSARTVWKVIAHWKWESLA